MTTLTISIIHEYIKKLKNITYFELANCFSSVNNDKQLSKVKFDSLFGNGNDKGNNES